MREKLIELQKTNCVKGKHCIEDCLACMADHLIANGVTIPVRCKDCKHYIAYSKKADGLCEWGRCKLISMDVDMPANGYCCYGERRTNV